MLVSITLVYVVLKSVVWWRQRQELTTISEINPDIFPFSIDRNKLQRGQYSLRVIHTNDLHAHFLPFDKQGNPCDPQRSKEQCRGGSAYIKTVIDHLRNGYKVGGKPSTLLFNAGDEFQGTYYFSLFKGNLSAQILNDFQIDSLTLGNHELDEGPLHLSKYLRLVKSPVIVSNLEFKSKDLLDLQTRIQPFTSIEQHRVGVIGLLTPETLSSSSIGDGLNITDPFTTVNKISKQLNGMGINRIVILSHLGYDQDKLLAERVDPGISLIIGGHTHTLLSNSQEDNPKGPYPTWIRNQNNQHWQTAIIQAKSWGEYVGYLDLVFNEDGSLDTTLTNGKAIAVDVQSEKSPVYGLKPSRKILDIIKPFKQQAEIYTSKIIGKSTGVFAQPLGNKDLQESALGNLIADAMVWADKKVAISLLGTGSIRGTLPKGDITRGALLDAAPFDDSLSKVQLRGSDIRKLVQRTSKLDKVLSSIQVSGIKFTNTSVIHVRTKVGEFNSRPFKDEHWELLDDNRLYSILAPTFLVKGGDGIFDTSSFTTNATVVAERYRDLVEFYISKFSPISPIFDHRKP
ncbi:hypothetical protein GGI12_004892 [Dipsacomyces acuminosporus]|nr:hypothetical protein GGI12_004892 [Dipsacomyces acuminosporus]